MHFCPKCGNMYYLKLLEEDPNKLSYYCRNCGHEDSSLIANLTNLYVSKKDVQKQMNYKNVINKYTKLDPTLPRISSIDCPNEHCSSNVTLNNGGESKNSQRKEKEILYIRYDDTNMKFVYLCANCDTIWKTDT
jgi:DNA-directed RNA polymerase subunit M/transcription elongation factor TFIIS